MTPNNNNGVGTNDDKNLKFTFGERDRDQLCDALRIPKLGLRFAALFIYAVRFVCFVMLCFVNLLAKRCAGVRFEMSEFVLTVNANEHVDTPLIVETKLSVLHVRPNKK